MKDANANSRFFMLYWEKAAFAIASSGDSLGRNNDALIDRSITENNLI